jgi:putative membrane protein
MKTLFWRLAMCLCACAALTLASVAMAAPSDGEILAIAHASNTAEIDAGKLAKSRAQNPQVRQFAKQMVADHSAMNTELAKNLDLKLMDNDESQRIRQDALHSLEQLKGMQGADFDKAYIDKQVMMHEEVVAMMQDKLIPNAQSPKLKAALDKAAPKVQSHLKMARQLQSSMQ